MLNNQIPFNNLPAIGQINFVVSDELKQASEQLKIKLAYLNGFLDASNTAEIAPFLDLIKITDLKFSMELENHPTAFSKLFEASVSENQMNDNLAKFIINNSQTTIKDGNKLKDYLLNDSMNKSFNIVFRERKEIQIKSYFTNLTLYTTPNNANSINFLKSDLNFWMNDNTTNNSLIMNCLIHCQIRAIGVYTQFNGQIARQYSNLFLSQLANHSFTLPISKQLVKQKEAYQTLFRKAVFENGYEAWCLFLFEIYTEAISDFIEKINAYKTIKAQTQERIEKSFDDYMPAKEITDLMFMQPFIKQKLFIEKHQLHRHTAASYLKKLTTIGLLQEKKTGRENLYFNKALYDVLVG